MGSLTRSSSVDRNIEARTEFTDVIFFEFLGVVSDVLRFACFTETETLNRFRKNNSWLIR